MSSRSREAAVAAPAVSAPRLRCALVGLGRIGRVHLEAVSAEGAEPVAIVEPREEAARSLAEHRGLVWARSLEDPRLPGGLEAAVVATPPSTHPELVRRLLETGVHVLCEKPLALTSREAREMLDLARRRGLVLMMASKFRYLDEIVEAKRLLEAGTLGRPLLLENAFCSKVPMKDRWNARKEVAGGGVLIDNGTHSADIARNLLGPVVEVQAHCGPSYQGLEVEDTARLLLRTRGGALGSIDLSWSLDKELDRYLAVYGTKGTLLVGWQGARYRQDGGSWVPFGRGYDKVGCLRAQFADFLAVIRGEAAPRMTAEDALASVEVIEAAYASAAEGRWVRVGEEG